MVPYSLRWCKARILLRSLSLLLALTVTAISVVNAAGGITKESRLEFNRGWKATLPAAATLILYDMIELVAFRVRRHVRRGLHPGASVGADLFAWMVACTLGIAFNTTLSDGQLAYDILGAEYNVYNLGYPGWLPLEYITASPIDIAASVLLAVLLILHFVLFVRACVETKQRNGAKSLSRVLAAAFDYTCQGEDRYMYTPSSGAAPFSVTSNTSELSMKLGDGDAASSTYASGGGGDCASEGVVIQPPASVGMLARPLSRSNAGSVRSVRDIKYF
ncbi:hypothetical protein B0H63DRAFT_545815 [Podospora didyma]|uniref:Uncharacterized protein n=1 Tax=Podospora didyma TaxID=330526 RepID=A0AAE0NGW3_9PEZI|nr:hypothetical protein B0H63DRAFT_545815 [Podospora didyma]